MCQKVNRGILEYQARQGETGREVRGVEAFHWDIPQQSGEQGINIPRVRGTTVQLSPLVPIS